jgi:hypothetical protein
MNGVRLSLLCCAALLGGCDHERELVSSRDYPTRLDTDCVSRVLEQEFPGTMSVVAHGYSGPSGTFPKGSPAEDGGAMVYYYDVMPNKGKSAELVIGDLKVGTRVFHTFASTRSKAELDQISKTMNRARATLQSNCQIDLPKLQVREISWWTTAKWSLVCTFLTGFD